MPVEKSRSKSPGCPDLRGRPPDPADHPLLPEGNHHLIDAGADGLSRECNTERLSDPFELRSPLFGKRTEESLQTILRKFRKTGEPLRNRLQMAAIFFRQKLRRRFGIVRHLFLEVKHPRLGH